MLISSSRAPLQIDPITIENITRISTTKLVGVHIQEDRKWDIHVDEIAKKASKKLYFLSQIRKVKVSESDLLQFYKSAIIPRCEYVCPVWSTSLSKSQISKIENIQKRVLRTIFLSLTYQETLQRANLSTLEERRSLICRKMFQNMKEPDNVLNHLIPEKIVSKCSLINSKEYPLLRCKSNRFKNSFVQYCLFHFPAMICFLSSQNSQYYLF